MFPSTKGRPFWVFYPNYEFFQPWEQALFQIMCEHRLLFPVILSDSCFSRTKLFYMHVLAGTLHNIPVGPYPEFWDALSLRVSPLVLAWELELPCYPWTLRSVSSAQRVLGSASRLSLCSMAGNLSQGSKLGPLAGFFSFFLISWGSLSFVTRCPTSRKLLFHAFCLS